MTEPFGKLAALIEPARQRINDAVDTYVSSPSLTGSRSHTHRDLGNKLDAKGHRKKDEAEQDLAQLNHLVRVVKHRHADGYDCTYQLQQLKIIINRWVPNSDTANYVARRTPTPDDGCVSCARVKNSQGDPAWSPRHTRSLLCQTCITDLRRVRARKGHDQAEKVPVAIVQWRHAHTGRQLREDTLDRLLSQRIV